MKPKLLSVTVTLFFVIFSYFNSNAKDWKLVWEDNFDQAQIDSANWSKIPRWHPDWARNMSHNDACYEMRNGNLVLKGIMNPDQENDTATVITGGVYTKNKRGFENGKLEIRAKLHGCMGAWPAIWMKPFEEEKFKWPAGGEIDIMERLNYDSIAYQTVHSTYTHTYGIKDNPPQSKASSINPNDYNVYGVEMYNDSIVFIINNKRTFAYPRIKTDKDGQFPFDKPFYLLIDMQLGGSWVGKVNTAELPVEMLIDWVRFYKSTEKRAKH